MPRRSDAATILITRGIRSFGDGFTSVLLAGYLTALGLSGGNIGAIATAALLGTAVSTLAIGGWTERFGRRRMLVLAALVAAATGIAMATVDVFVLLLIVAFLGTVNPTAGDVSVFLPVEQAILPQTVEAARRTDLFARYNLVGAFAAAGGALFAAAPGLISRWTAIDSLDVARAMFVLYAGLALVNFALYRTLTAGAEPAAPPNRAPLHRSRGVVTRLSALFALDAFAGGFIVQSMLALWLFNRYGLSIEQTAAIFFVSGVLSAFSFLVAARISQRIGLVNTMVFTHLPSNILLILVALMPGAWLAVAMLLMRQALSQMDVPTRQSYVMAVVDADERAAAASVTSVARSISAAWSPWLSGLMLGASTFGWPLVISGSLKCVYDGLILHQFRRLRPEEEIVRVQSAER